MALSDMLRGRRRAILIVLALLGVCVLALVLWIGNLADPGAGARDVTAQPGGAGASGGAPLGAGASASGAPGSAAGRLPALPLPPFSTDINGASHGTHAVSMRASSDATLLQLAYSVRGGRPPSNYHSYVRSPSSVSTVAHGDGIVVEFAVQASPLAKTVTCSVTVDGVTTTHTAHGGYAVVVCIG